MRLIDADELPRFGHRGGLVHWKDIEDAPTIEAVPVVRCRECVFQRLGFCRFWQEDITESDFCSYGEREGE